MSGTYPENCRVFIGNLASEKTSPEELKAIFGKYGNIVEEPVLRRSFGFIQYDNPVSVRKAIESENGRQIGGMRIDLDVADNRGSRKTRNRERERERDPRDRYNKRPSSPEGDRAVTKRPHIDPYGLSNVILCQIFYLGPQQKDYATQIQNRIINEVGGFAVQSREIDKRTIRENINRAEANGVRYAFVIGRYNQSKETVSMHLLRGTSGKAEGYDELPIPAAIQKLKEEELLRISPHLSINNNSNADALSALLLQQAINQQLAQQIAVLSSIQSNTLPTNLTTNTMPTLPNTNLGTLPNTNLSTLQTTLPPNMDFNALAKLTMGHTVPTFPVQINNALNTLNIQALLSTPTTPVSPTPTPIPMSPPHTSSPSPQDYINQQATMQANVQLMLAQHKNKQATSGLYNVTPSPQLNVTTPGYNPSYPSLNYLDSNRIFKNQ